MAEHRKLSSKINYHVLDDLFSDDPAPDAEEAAGATYWPHIAVMSRSIPCTYDPMSNMAHAPLGHAVGCCRCEPVACAARVSRSGALAGRGSSRLIDAKCSCAFN